MTNSEQAIREFAEKWGIKQNDEPTFDPHTENLYYGYTHCVKQCLSDLTALISDGYVSKEAYNVIKEHYQSALAAKDVEKDYIDKYYYPKEFVEWMIKNEVFMGFPFERNNEGKLILSDTRDMTTKSAVFTTDELFNYWEENVQ